MFLVYNRGAVGRLPLLDNSGAITISLRIAVVANSHTSANGTNAYSDSNIIGQRGCRETRGGGYN
jgi:hypothetical protein